MQDQPTVPRRMMRNRPYDLRKRVLLKNFLRAQNANQNISVFNLAYLNTLPTFSGETLSSEHDGKEQKQPEEVDSKIHADEPFDSNVQGSGSWEYSQVNNFQNSSDGKSSSNDILTQEICLQPLRGLKQPGITEKNSFDTAIIGEVALANPTESPQTLSTDTKQSPSGSKSSIQNKLYIKKPYTFCRRKSLRDPTKKKIRNGITKAKHGYKHPKSPSKRKFNTRSVFSQMFSRKTNSHGHGIEDVVYDNHNHDRKEHGNFFAKLFNKSRSTKPQPFRSSHNSAVSSDRSDNSVPAFPVNEYNLRSVSRSVQTDFSMCCHDFSFGRNARNRFCENGYCGPEDDPVVTNGESYQHKHSDKRRRYSDSRAFFSSSSFSRSEYPDSSVGLKRLHNSLYCNEQYGRNEFQNPHQLARSRSISERPSIVEASRCQRSKSLRAPNPQVEYNFRNLYTRSESMSKPLLSSHSVMRSKDVFSENFLNQRYGLDVQHRSPSLLPNPPKQASSSVFRSSSMRESSRNSPLLRKNPVLCRRTRSVNDRCSLDRMASYYK